MRREWPQEALSFQDSVRSVTTSLGGVDRARLAEAEPASRAAVGAALDQLGLLELDPVGDEGEAAAAALGAQAVGASVLPWPLVHQLAVPVEMRSELDAVYLGDGRAPRLDHADLFHRAALLDEDRQVWSTVAAGRRSAAPLDPFAVEVDLESTSRAISEDVALVHHVLDAFWISGAVSTSVRLAARHASDRTQFGVPIGRFGEIRWRIADMVVARDGLDELARFTWARLRAGVASRADVLALRLQALEAATAVLTHGHQVLGAMGLCEEHDLTVIDRHLQPVLRRPGGVLSTSRRLATAVSVDGFEGVYPVEAWR